MEAVKNVGIQVTEQQSEPGYFFRNSDWLIHLIGTLLMMLLTYGYESLKIVDPVFESIQSIPVGLVATVCVVGLSASAFYACRARTLSANIFLWAIVALANFGTWYMVIRFIYSFFQ